MSDNYVNIRDDEKFYYQVVRKTIVQFLDLFDGIVIGRYDTTNGKLLKYVTVPLKFAPKMKHWYWVEKQDDITGKRQRDIILPMIACQLNSIDQANDRNVNQKYRARTRTKTDPTIERFFHPVPFDYNFDVSIAAEYMVDIVQIVERILPFFDNYMYLRLVIPELDIISDDSLDGAHPLDLKVIYDGGSKEETVTFGEDEYRTIIWTLSFKVEGYMFKPKYTYPIIKRVIQDYKTSYNEDPIVLTTTTGLSADKYPIPVSPSASSNAFYDDDMKLLYKYEIEE